jgi:thiol-disulfide isomerase/thioredoxin
LELSLRSLIVCLPILCAFAAAACDKAKPDDGQDTSGPAIINGAAGGDAGGATPPGNEGSVDRSHKGAKLSGQPFAAPGGAPATFGAWRGKPVLVNLWATWCAPCVRELPTLDALAAREAGRIGVVAVSQDMGGDKTVAPFWKAKGYRTLTAYTDGKNLLMAAMQADVLPTTILYDARGRELWRVTGGMDWSGAEAAKLLAEAGG